MTDRDELDASVAEGVITAEQAAAIRARRPAAPAQTEEPFRLVSNFGDVFLCLGLVILYWSMAGFLALGGVSPLMVFVGFAALYWLLAEYFTFRARRKFPAVVSAALFAWMAYRAGMLAFGETSLAEVATGGGVVENLAILIAALGAALIRFRLPILVLGVALASVALVFTLAMTHLAGAPALWVLGGCGAALIAVGILLDRRDPARTGQPHEWALWLFVVGSPLLVHSVILSLIGERIGAVPTLAGEGADFWLRLSEGALSGQVNGLVWMIVGLAIAFSVLGLWLDRRSLVASTLLYLSAVLTYAAFQAGLGFALAAAIIPLCIGLLVIVLGVAWEPIRRATGLARR